MNVSSSLGILFAVGLTSVPALASAADQASMPPVTVTAPAPSSSRQTPDTNNSSGVSTNPNANTPGQTNLSPLPLQPSLPPDSGLFPGLGRTLLDHGFDFHGLVADHFVDNSGAGAQPGNKANLDIVRLELDVDLSKAIGLKGGYVHVADTWFWGRDDVSKIVLQTGGAIDGYQTTPVAVASTLTTLTYEQRLLDDRLSVEVGRTNPHRNFFIPNSIDPFSYDSTVIYLDGDVNSYPYSQWGGRAAYHFTPKWYVQAGGFEDNYEGSIRRPYNFGTKFASGADIIGELAYRSEFSNARYPANLELGYFYDTRSGPNNVKGEAAPYSARSAPVDYDGAGIIFFQGLQTVWRGKDRGGDAPPANISIYSSADYTTSHPQPIDMDALVGVNFAGLVPFRANDVFEVKARYQKLSSVEAGIETRLRDVTGPGSPYQKADAVMYEAIDRVQITPWFTIQPLVQYFKNPDNYFVPAVYHTQPHSGILFGLYASFGLGPLLGTSRKPF